MMVKFSKKVYPKHKWVRDGGKIDFFAFAVGYHNGPQCDRCGFSYCEHCQDGKSPEYFNKEHPCIVRKWTCPKCDIELGLTRHNFCHNCGEQLTWEKDYD